MSDTIRKHEAAAAGHIVEAMKGLEAARQAAEHGDYQGAGLFVREARDRLYFTEIELRQAHLAARREK